MDKKYRALRTIGTIYKVVGVIVAIAAVVAFVGLVVAGALGGGRELSSLWRSPRHFGQFGAYGLVGGLVSGFVVLLSGAWVALGLFALGEGIYLAIGVEENTRASALALQGLRARPSAPASPPES